MRGARRRHKHVAGRDGSGLVLCGGSLGNKAAGITANGRAIKASAGNGMTNPMKKLIVPTMISFAAASLLTGCLNLQLGGGTTNRGQSPTVGQQLIDLQQAKERGAITEAEYQSQKLKILGQK